MEADAVAPWPATEAAHPESPPTMSDAAATLSPRAALSPTHHAPSGSLPPSPKERPLYVAAADVAAAAAEDGVEVPAPGEFADPTLGQVFASYLRPQFQSVTQQLRATVGAAATAAQHHLTAVQAQVRHHGGGGGGELEAAGDTVAAVAGGLYTAAAGEVVEEAGAGASGRRACRLPLQHHASISTCAEPGPGTCPSHSLHNSSCSLLLFTPNALPARRPQAQARQAGEAPSLGPARGRLRRRRRRHPSGASSAGAAAARGRRCARRRRPHRQRPPPGRARGLAVSGSWRRHAGRLCHRRGGRLGRRLRHARHGRHPRQAACWAQWMGGHGAGGGRGLHCRRAVPRWSASSGGIRQGCCEGGRDARPTQHLKLQHDAALRQSQAAPKCPALDSPPPALLLRCLAQARWPPSWASRAPPLLATRRPITQAAATPTR